MSALAELEALHVRIVGVDKGVNLGWPDAKSKERYTITKTFIPSAVPEIMLPQSPKRKRFFIRTLGSAGGIQSTVSTYATQPSGVAGAVITTLNIAAGQYQVSMQASTGAGSTAADLDNIGLYVNGVLIYQPLSNIDPTTGTLNASTVNQVFSIGTPGTVSIRMIGAGTAAGAASYRGSMTVTPVSTSSGNIILAGSYGDAAAAAAAVVLSQASPGIQMPVNSEVHGQGQTELWLVSPFTNPCPVSVFAEYER